MSRCLLASSSRVHGLGLFEHCLDAIARQFADVGTITFIPFALADWDKYEATIQTAFQPLGLSVTSLHRATDRTAAIAHAEGIFIGGGNTFRLLKSLYDSELIEPLKTAVLEKQVPYMGSSAGTNMACPTIRTSNDMPIVQPPSFAALGFVPFQINPHYLDADPNSTHKGETREQRLTEYLEENSAPVVGLREGSWLEVEGDRCRLLGSTGMKLFRPSEPPQEFSSGDVSFLLQD